MPSQGQSLLFSSAANLIVAYSHFTGEERLPNNCLVLGELFTFVTLIINLWN